MVWLNLTMLLCILWSSNCYESNTQIGRNPVFLNSLFCTCIPILFLSISYPCIVRILKFKQALTQLLLLQICVKENLVWFVLLLPRRRSPHLSCSIDRSIHQTRHHDTWPSFAAWDLLPYRRHPPQRHHHHRLSRWTCGVHGSTREVALFCFYLCYAFLNITYYTTKKYTSVMIRVCHNRSRFLSCMYIHDKFLTKSR